MSSGMQFEYFECKCHGDVHVLRYYIDRENNEVYTSVYLNPWRPWYWRVWNGFRYMFGYQCRGGAWDCTIMKNEQIPALIALLQSLDEEK